MADVDLLNDFEQVQEPVSSSGGDMAEEDRYDPKTTDLLGDFGGGADTTQSQSSSSGMDRGIDDLVNFAMTSSSVQDIPETKVTESTPPREPLDHFSEPVKEEEQPESVAAVSAQGNLLKNVDPRVLELVYWKDIKKTGIVFGTMMFILLSLACFTLLSVIAYLSLAVLTVTFTFRVYKNVMQAVQKSSGDHPFKKLMEMDVELSDEVVKKAADNIARHMNNCSQELRRLYLVGDYVDSLKFGLLLWVLTYIGAWFDGMTLIILAVVSIFTLPKVYDTYKVQIDSYINLVRGQLNKIMAQITSKIPFPKKKAKTQ